jgi:hypothetical protein
VKVPPAPLAERYVAYTFDNPCAECGAYPPCGHREAVVQAPPAPSAPKLPSVEKMAWVIASAWRKSSAHCSPDVDWLPVAEAALAFLAAPQPPKPEPTMAAWIHEHDPRKPESAPAIFGGVAPCDRCRRVHHVDAACEVRDPAPVVTNGPHLLVARQMWDQLREECAALRDQHARLLADHVTEVGRLMDESAGLRAERDRYRDELARDVEAALDMHAATVPLVESVEVPAHGVDVVVTTAPSLVATIPCRDAEQAKAIAALLSIARVAKTGEGE